MLQFSTPLRNARLDAIDATIGRPTLEIRAGKMPINCSTADSGRLLASLALPARWLAPAQNGVKQLTGRWKANAEASGIATYFRIINGGICHVQGSVGMSIEDMVVDNDSFQAGQEFTVQSFTISESNA
jgi:hypothetical protein